MERFGSIWHDLCIFGYGMKKDLPSVSSPLDLWKLIGGKTQRVTSSGKGPEDSLLAVYKTRVTYTFILGDEVASIHFDQARREIFFKGHNIRNLPLGEPEVQSLWHFKDVLRGDPRGAPFLSDYEATLGASLAENK